MLIHSMLTKKNIISKRINNLFNKELFKWIIIVKIKGNLQKNKEDAILSKLLIKFTNPCIKDERSFFKDPGISRGGKENKLN